MFKIKTALRLAFFVTLIVGGNLWLAIAIRMTPRPEENLLSSRVRQAQTLGASVAALAESGKLDRLRTMLEHVNQQDEDLESIGIRRPSGGYRLSVGEHEREWTGAGQTAEEISVGIQAHRSLWGHLELRYRSESRQGWSGWLLEYPANFVLFLSTSTCLLAWLLFSRIFRYLDPTRVIPGRVRSALDTLAEGLVLLDPSETIVHANGSFCKMLNVEPDSLVGKRLDRWSWQTGESSPAAELPWTTGLRLRSEQDGVLLCLNVDGETRKYLVNANPILGDHGTACRGILISFDDVTLLEKKKQDLAETVESLRSSRDEIHQQNRKLRFLASRDPLTSCFNRRSFWEAFEEYWKKTSRQNLSVLMVDLDHFKAINDNHGHSTGDMILRETGAMLIHLVGKRGMVCRFGGEEFTILLPGMDFSLAADVAETLHTAFQHCRVGGLEVTASIGLSSCRFGAMDPQHLLDQADQCLYAAKRNGRNQVVRFDQIQNLPGEKTPDERTVELHEKVPWSTVTALFSVFSQSYPQAVRQRKKAAELCLHVGRPFLFRQQVYWMEAASLLQQFGESLLPGPNPGDPASGKPAADTLPDTPTGGQRPLFPGDEHWNQVSVQAVRSGDCLEKIVGSCEIADILKSVPGAGQSLFRADVEAHTIHAAATILGICCLRTVLQDSPDNAVAGIWLQLAGEIRNRLDASSLQCRILDRLDAVEAELAAADSIPTVSPEIIATIERHHDQLNLAIAGQNKSKLGQATASILRDLPPVVDKKVAWLVDRLDKGARQRDPAFDELAALTDQMLDLCRLARRSVSDSRQAEELSHPHSCTPEQTQPAS